MDASNLQAILAIAGAFSRLGGGSTPSNAAAVVDTPTTLAMPLGLALSDLTAINHYVAACEEQAVQPATSAHVGIAASLSTWSSCTATGAAEMWQLPPDGLLSTQLAQNPLASQLLQQGALPEGTTPAQRQQAITCLESVAAVANSTDVWNDPIAMQLIQTGTLPADTLKPQRDTAVKRLKRYRWDGKQLLRYMADGSTRVVPPPQQRAALIAQCHSLHGHPGARRTTALLATHYWWRGISVECVAYVASCELCDRGRAGFNAVQPHLHPLPVQCLFYRWSCDLAGDFDMTPSGNKYVMICVEHYSKFMVLAPLPDKTARSTAIAFSTYVLGFFGAPAEVLTDQGNEWEGEFANLLHRALCDHRRCSPNHPQADGLTERCVQTVKRALRKLCTEDGTSDQWDLHLGWIALGCNASPQESTRFPPYAILYARTPTVPPAVRERLAQPLAFDPSDPACVHDLLDRAAAMRQACALAGSNLLLAQHRDTRRYAAVRGGSYQPRPAVFQPGDYVYVLDPEARTLQLTARPHILRVKAVGPTGTLKLEGRDTRTITVNADQCAPCHLPNIDPTTYSGLQPAEDDLACERCGHQDGDAYMLVCDHCGQGWHTYCLPSPLAAPPPPEDPTPWLCPRCEHAGVDPASIQQQQQQLAAEQLAHEQTLVPPTQLHGKPVTKLAKTPGTRLPIELRGTVRYTGADARTRCLFVDLEDGSVEGPYAPRKLRNLYQRSLFATRQRQPQLSSLSHTTASHS